MNKKQLLERQITKDFINESGFAGQKFGQALKSIGMDVASKFIPLASLAGAAKDLVDAAKHKEVSGNLDQVGKNDEEHFLDFVNNLNKLTSPNKLESYREGNRIDFVKLINDALSDVLINGSRYRLSGGIEGPAGGENKRPGL